MRKIISLLFLGLGLIFCSCAGTAPQVHQFENKVVFESSFDEVWSAIIETFAERNIPITNMEKVSGFIATEEMKFESEYADCGTTYMGTKFGSGGVLGKFNVFVKELSPRKYNVTINALYRVDVSYRAPAYRNCESTGKLEAWFMATLRTKLYKP
jgi:hypothetical protein